jgi:DnaK suppressor protein
MATRKQSRVRGKPKARTEEVLGKALRPIIRGKWRDHYARLLKLQGALLSRQSDLARDAREEQPQFGTHMADAGTDTYDRDFALGLLSSEQDALYEVEQALDRIRHGNYGICEASGKRIPLKRLEAIPWTRFTAEAETQLEAQGSLKRPHLGPRASVAQIEREEEED